MINASQGEVLSVYFIDSMVVNRIIEVVTVELVTVELSGTLCGQKAKCHHN